MHVDQAISMPPLQTIEAAAKITGLSRYYLRQGCRAGTIPCIRSGSKYLVNIPLLLERLDAMSRQGPGEAVG